MKIESSPADIIQSSDTPHKTYPHVNKIKYIVMFSVLVLGVIGLYTMQQRTDINNRVDRELMALLPGSKTSPIPIPFIEMTIPYLRVIEFNSSLTDLEETGNNDIYTSYLASYRSDGLQIYGLLTRPLGEMPKGGFPAIVFIHGYIPPNQYVTTEKYVDYVDYLARNGFVVFKIDLRGHGNSEGEAGGGYFGSDYVTDALSAYSALENTDFVNKEKIGMWGHSMAGNTIARSMAVRSSIPAGVIWAGAVYSYTDLRKYSINDTSYSPPQQITQRQNRRRELFEKYGSPSAQSTFWQKVAPTNYLSDLKGAIEIHHSIDDEVVNIGYSRDFAEELEKNDVIYGFYEYDAGGHNISGVNFGTAMQRTVAFFNLHLK